MAPPAAQSSTPTPTPPSPPTSPPPPRVRAGGELNGRASTPPPACVAHPIVHRSATRPPASPDRRCAAAHCWEDDYDVPPAIRHLLAAKAPRPQAHQQPTKQQEPNHPMPPRSISPASTADQNAEHQREEPDPDRAATPKSPPPPPQDIYATLASTLAPMDAEQYCQSIQRDLPRGPRDPPGVGAGEKERQRVGHGGGPSLGRHRGRHQGRLPRSSSPNLPPPARGH